MRLGVLCGLVASVASAGPPGKVVRVERRTRGSGAEPSLCQFQTQDATGICLGAVKPGDIAFMLSTEAVVGEVRIDEVSPIKPTCQALQNVRGTVLRGSIGGSTLGIVSRGIDPVRARMLADRSTTPSPNGRDDVQAAVDRDGDGVADMVMTQSPCDPAASGGGSCFDIWAGSTVHAMHQVQHVNLQSCF